MATREPPEMAVLSYEARSLYWMMQPLLDEDGCIDCGARPAEYLSLLLRAPLELVETPLEELCRNGGFDKVSSCQNSGSVTISDKWFASRNDRLASRDEMTEYKNKNKKKKEDKDNGAEKRPGRPPADARYRPVLDAWIRHHQNARGEKPLIDGKHGKNLSRLLAKIPDATIEDIEQRMKVALVDPWFQKAGDLSIFCSKWNNYSPRASTVSPQATTPDRSKVVVDMDPETGAFIYADGHKAMPK